MEVERKKEKERAEPPTRTNNFELANITKYSKRSGTWNS